MNISMGFTTHGRTFRLTSSHSDIVAAFEHVLVDMAEPIGPPDHVIEVDPADGSLEADARRYRVRIDGAMAYATLSEGALVSHVLMEVNLRVAAAVSSTGSVPLHASVAAGTEGAIVIPGASYSGKSTLAAALASGSRTAFVADEVTALDATDDIVIPYGKPVALRAPSVDLLAPRLRRLRRPGSNFELDERFVPPSDFGPPARTPLPVAAIVFPRFRDQHPVPITGERPRLDVVAPVEALMRLMELTLGSGPVGVATFRRLERLVRDVEAYELSYVDALAAADHLDRELLSRPAD